MTRAKNATPVATLSIARRLLGEVLPNGYVRVRPSDSVFKLTTGKVAPMACDEIKNGEYDNTRRFMFGKMPFIARNRVWEDARDEGFRTRFFMKATDAEALNATQALSNPIAWGLKLDELA